MSGISSRTASNKSSWSTVRHASRSRAASWSSTSNSVLTAFHSRLPAAVTGYNHALHFVLTLLTCGLWAIVWLFVALDNHKTFRTVDAAGNVKVVPNGDQRMITFGVCAAVVVLLMLANHHPGVVGVIVLAALVGVGGRCALKRADAADPPNDPPF
jgi:hypothetical protein